MQLRKQALDPSQSSWKRNGYVEFENHILELNLARDGTKECPVFCQGPDADEVVGGVLHLVVLLHIQPAHQQALLVLPVAGSYCLGQRLAAR